MSKKIRIGIVGTGNTPGVSKNHVKAYCNNPNTEIVALYDILAGRAAEWAKKQPGLSEEVKICATYEEILEHVDAISICTPNYSHVRLAIKALEAGKHVLCEKPLSTTYDEAVEALKYAKSSGLVHMVGFRYRGIPAIKYMKQLIDEGKIGKVYTYRETMGGTRIANPDVKLEWRMQEDLSGTGALADFGCHMLDLADFFLRDSEGKITEVCGVSNTFITERQIIGSTEYGPVTNDDSAAFSAKTENGALLSFVASRLGVYDHTIEVYGSGGMILFEQNNPRELKVNFKDFNGGYAGKLKVLSVPDELIVENSGFGDEVNQFINAIINGAKATPGFEQGVYIQKLVDAIKLSIDEGRTVIVD